MVLHAQAIKQAIAISKAFVWRVWHVNNQCKYTCRMTNKQTCIVCFSKHTCNEWNSHLLEEQLNNTQAG